jgi:anti-sigma factor RsiW
MHAVVLENLEEFLAGTLEPAEIRIIEAHLGGCEMCRKEVRSMLEISALFGSLRNEETFEPAPGFYARVSERVGAQKAPPVFGTVFGLDFALGMRLALACLLTLAALGGYLVSRETSFDPEPTPDAIMAQQNLPAFDSAPATDNMLVTLTTYEH